MTHRFEENTNVKAKAINGFAFAVNAYVKSTNAKAKAINEFAFAVNAYVKSTNAKVKLMNGFALAINSYRFFVKLHIIHPPAIAVPPW
ncbi:hypothetical protein Cal7507_3871 [Calothrix sp. PCC 7507]|nr:hypothetical protein Cal7507_3871 [Calothrix sp. PCC 7507]